MTWLVTGGAGFVGVHVVHALTAAGEQVVVLDDLSTGLESRLEEIEDVSFVKGSVNTSLVARLLSDYEIEGVVHLAAKKLPEESVAKPVYYYRENVGSLVSLLRGMEQAGVGKLVFSSTAAVYGDQDVDVLTEDLACRPANPYGETKLAGEWMIAAAAKATGLRYVNLRYFNAAGAARPEYADTGAHNLIPKVFERLTEGESPQIFGTDYPTPDGTTIRDYVHVSDIATAHVLAARRLADGAELRTTLNIGTGNGSSTRQVVDTILDVTGHRDRTPELLGRRAGDPAVSIASAEKACQELGWAARHDLASIVDSAWQGWLGTRSDPSVEVGSGT